MGLTLAHKREEKSPGMIRGWFLKTCTMPGCNRPKPKFTRVCETHKDHA